MLPNEHAQIGAVQLALDDHGRVEAEEQKVEAGREARGREARGRRLAMVILNLTEAKQKYYNYKSNMGTVILGRRISHKIYLVRVV